MEQGTRFKAMYASLGLTVDDVANFLQVSPRTVQLWISGRVRIPYAAYKLVRLQLRYELPGDAWKGWHLSAGRLYTPEGFELNPHDFSWWGLLVRRASMFSVCYTDLVSLRAARLGELAMTAGRPAGDVRGYAEACAQSFAPALEVPARSAPDGNHGESYVVGGASLGPYCYAWPSTYVFHPLSKPLRGSTASASASVLTRSSASLLTPICDSLSDRLSPLHLSHLLRHSVQVLPLSCLLPRLTLPCSSGTGTSRQQSSSASSGSVNSRKHSKGLHHLTLSQSCPRTPRRPTAPVLRSGTSATPPSDQGGH